MNIIKQLKKIIPDVVDQFDAIEMFYLFGSHASGNASTDSDVDVAVVVDENTYRYNPLVDLEVALLLEDRLCKPVDVVVMNRVSAILQHEVLSVGKRLFERSPQRRSAFELRSFKEYLDVKYYQRKRFGMV